MKLIQLFKFNTLIKTLSLYNNISTFVQVGAHDGKMHDPLREFILKNKWAGLFIEPQKEMIEKCKKNYNGIENLIFINCAVHPTKTNVTLYKVDNAQDYSHTGWASIIPDRFSDTIYKNSYIEENVQAMPLMKIIRDNNIDNIDILQIDTEGFDSEVIDMFDFNHYSPALIQYEHVHLSDEKSFITKHNLTLFGYYIIKKKNDTIAIRKDLITVWFIVGYISFRIYASITSRINNFLKN